MHGDKLLQGHSGFAGELGHVTVELERSLVRLRQSRLPGDRGHRRGARACGVGADRATLGN